MRLSATLLLVTSLVGTTALAAETATRSCTSLQGLERAQCLVDQNRGASQKRFGVVTKKSSSSAPSSISSASSSSSSASSVSSSSAISSVSSASSVSSSSSSSIPEGMSCNRLQGKDKAQCLVKQHKTLIQDRQTGKLASSVSSIAMPVAVPATAAQARSCARLTGMDKAKCLQTAGKR